MTGRCRGHTDDATADNQHIRAAIGDVAISPAQHRALGCGELITPDGACHGQDPVRKCSAAAAVRAAQLPGPQIGQRRRPA